MIGVSFGDQRPFAKSSKSIETYRKQSMKATHWPRLRAKGRNWTAKTESPNKKRKFIWVWNGGKISCIICVLFNFWDGLNIIICFLYTYLCVFVFCIWIFCVVIWIIQRWFELHSSFALCEIQYFIRTCFCPCTAVLMAADCFVYVLHITLSSLVW